MLDIAEWIKTTETPRLVILDTLAGVKPIKTTSGYAEDYESLTSLHRIANDVGIGILVLHHTRKLDAEDPLDTISGTLGLAGCADTALVFVGSSQGMTLYVRGRDMRKRSMQSLLTSMHADGPSSVLPLTYNYPRRVNSY